MEARMSNANVALVKRWFEEIWNELREETIDELLTPESCCLSPVGRLVGPEDFKARVYQPFLDTFSDIRVKIEGTVTEGDQVVVRWSSTAVHTGDGLGFPATGRRAEFHGMTWVRCGGGKMIEGWDCWDFSGVIRSLQEGHTAGAAPGGG